MNPPFSKVLGRESPFSFLSSFPSRLSSLDSFLSSLDVLLDSSSSVFVSSLVTFACDVVSSRASDLDSSPVEPSMTESRLDDVFCRGRKNGASSHRSNCEATVSVSYGQKYAVTFLFKMYKKSSHQIKQRDDTKSK